MFAVSHKHEWKCLMVWWNWDLMFLAIIPKTCFAQKPHCTSADERPSSQTIFCFWSPGTTTLVVLLLIKLILAYCSRVDHVIGIRGTSLDYYRSYLSEKYQFACGIVMEFHNVLYLKQSVWLCTVYASSGSIFTVVMVNYIYPWIQRKQSS